MTTLAIPRDFGMLQYTLAGDYRIDGGDSVTIYAVAEPNALPTPIPATKDDFGMCFGGVLPKAAPVAGQRPTYRAWFVPTFLADVEGTGVADGGLVTVNITTDYGSSGMNKFEIVVANNNVETLFVEGVLYVELIHSIVR